MAKLRDQLARLLPRILPADPSKAVLGVSLASQLKTLLPENYAVESIRATLSAMVREVRPVIGKVDSGHGYYLLNTTEISQPHQVKRSPDDELTQPGTNPKLRSSPRTNFTPHDAVTNPGPVQMQVRAAFLDAIPRQAKSAVSYQTLLGHVSERLPGLNRNTLQAYFSRLVQERDLGVVKTPEGRIYLADSVQAPKSSVRSLSKGDDRVLTRKVRALEELLDGSNDDAFGLPSTLPAALQGDEMFALRVLARIGSCRSTELAERIGRPAGRMAGMMRALRRKLHALGLEIFSAEALPDGETLFRFVRKESR